MNTLNKFSAVLGVVSVLTLGGCGTLSDPFGTSGTADSGAISAGNAFAGSGVVQSINLLSNNLYRFTIRMDNGANQTLTNASTSGYSVGDRVRIENGSMRRF